MQGVCDVILMGRSQLCFKRAARKLFTGLPPKCLSFLGLALSQLCSFRQMSYHGCMPTVVMATAARAPASCACCYRQHRARWIENASLAPPSPHCQLLLCRREGRAKLCFTEGESCSASTHLLPACPSILAWSLVSHDWRKPVVLPVPSSFLSLNT